MVLRKSIILCLLFSGFLSAQNLFFTDSYQTNLYQSNIQEFTFHNNVFSLMDKENEAELYALIEVYFQEINLTTQLIATSNSTQISYRFNTTIQEPLNWSRVWHLKYESQLIDLLNNFLKEYYSQELDSPLTIKDAAIKKQAYYTIKNYKDRSSVYIKTNLSISLTNINVKAFSEKHLPPNLSLKRAVTNSLYTYYNEAYPVQDIKKPYIFVFGPTQKARLKDCVAMHLLVHLNNLPEVIYLSNYSVLVLDSLNQDAPIKQDALKSLLPKVEREILKIINDPAYSFYNIDDKESLRKIIEEYQLSDYKNFRSIYLEQNSHNVAQPIENFSLCYNKAILESTIEFKENSHSYKTDLDTTTLNTLALFLINNKLENVVIIGYAGSAEYTKIDQLKYLQIVDKYKEYTPVKSSRKAELSIYRAVVVFDYLIQKGVDPTSLTCMSKTLKNSESLPSIVNFTTR